MFSSKLPTQNEFNDIFGGSLSHNVCQSFLDCLLLNKNLIGPVCVCVCVNINSWFCVSTGIMCK